MTISSTASRVSYAGNGSTKTFAVPFYFLADGHLQVVLGKPDNTEVVYALTTNYTVANAGNPSGGSITLTSGTAAPAFGETLVIVRNVPLTQETDYQANDDFPAESHERALDKLTMEVQQLQEQVDRSAKLPVTNPTDADALVADIVRLADSADNIDTVATNVADVNTVASGIGDVAVVSTNIDDVTVVSTDIANVNTVADDLNEPVSEINTVAVNIADVNTVGGNIASVNTVAGISGNVTTVAGISSNVTTVAGKAAEVTTVAGIAGDVTTVAGIAGDVSAVENISANVTTVAGISANVTTVAGISGNVTTVAGNNANVTTVATNIASVNSAATNMAAIIAAPSEASAAAASAAAAAASAASGMYSAVQDKSADYTVVVGDAGDLIRMTTSGGSRTVTLPAISTVPDGFNVTAVKWTGDTNNVTVTRSGSDTINGSTSYVLDAQYKSATFVADSATSTWFASGSGSSSTNIIVDAFNGTGSQTAFTLSGDPGTENNTQVFVGGVYQEKDTYSVSGSTLTFSAAPPAGTSNIEIVWSQPLAIGTPADGSVGTVKLGDSAVTTAKIADNNVTYAKLAADVQGSMYGFKNRIINGAMAIDQRSAGASVTATDSAPYTLDRWWVYSAPTSKFTVQQNAGSVTPPAGFANYLGVTSSSSYSVTSADQFLLAQSIEGFNVADLAWGTANAKSVTLSFQVYSSLTGTFAGSIQNGTNTRSFVFSYTIPSANTWTQVSVTIAGDTSGTWAKNNSAGLLVILSLGAGSNYNATANTWSAGNYKSVSGATSVVGTSGATFYITGVQLEKGSTATSFDYRPYGTELALAQRYYFQSLKYVARLDSLSEAKTGTNYPVEMRANPTITGGGAGFSTVGASTLGVYYWQTASGNPTLTFTSEL